MSSKQVDVHDDYGNTLKANKNPMETLTITISGMFHHSQIKLKVWEVNDLRNFLTNWLEGEQQ